MGGKPIPKGNAQPKDLLKLLSCLKTIRPANLTETQQQSAKISHSRAHFSNQKGNFAASN